jgi:hypothetical protein
MKRYFTVIGLISFLFALSAGSCKKEKSSEELLIGRLNLDSEKTTSFENGVKTDKESITYEPGEKVKEIIKNGTGKYYEDGNLTEIFDWEIVGYLLIVTIVTPPTGDNPVEAEFTVNENTMTLRMTEEFTFNQIVYKLVFDAILKRA